MIKLCDPGIETQYKVSDLEDFFCDYLDMPFAVATNSGTAALHLAMIDAEIKDKSILAPAICFRAIINAIEYCGGKIKYRDVDEWTNAFLVGEADMACLVHNYGFPCLYFYEESLIEDASEALGAKLENKKVGTYGNYIILSFNWNKLVTSGSGGMVLVRDKKQANHIRHLANQAKADKVYFIHDEVGYNYRMNDLQAEFLMRSLKEMSIEARVERKREIAKYYADAGLPIVLEHESMYASYWLTLLRHPKRDKILRHLAANDIECRACFYPHAKLPNAWRLSQEILCLPSSLSITQWEQDQVIEKIKEIIC